MLRFQIKESTWKQRQFAPKHPWKLFGWTRKICTMKQQLTRIISARRAFIWNKNNPRYFVSTRILHPNGWSRKPSPGGLRYAKSMYIKILQNSPTKIRTIRPELPIVRQWIRRIQTFNIYISFCYISISFQRLLVSNKISCFL